MSEDDLDFFEPHYVHCDDPYNIEDVVGAVYEATNFILDRLPEDVPLVILIPEQHRSPAHNALHQALIHAHVNEFNVAVGSETSHDFYTHTLETRELEPQTDDDVDAVNLEALLNYSSWKVSDFSKKALGLLCQNLGISISFNDLSVRYSGAKDAFLDVTDSYTHEIIAHFFPDFVNEDELDADSAVGSAIRNLGILNGALNHIERKKPRIYFQHCGRAHVFDLDCYDIDPMPEFSLSGLFRRHGFAVLSVFPLLAGEDISAILPEGANTNNTIFVTGMTNDGPYEDCQEELALWSRMDKASGGIIGAWEFNF